MTKLLYKKNNKLKHAGKDRTTLHYDTKYFPRYRIVTFILSYGCLQDSKSGKDCNLGQNLFLIRQSRL